MQAARASSENKFNAEFRFEKYVWITIGWYVEDWWKVERMADSDTNCTDADVEQFLPNTLAILHANTAENDSATTDVDLVSGRAQPEGGALWSVELLTVPLYRLLLSLTPGTETC